MLIFARVVAGCLAASRFLQPSNLPQELLYLAELRMRPTDCLYGLVIAVRLNQL